MKKLIIISLMLTLVASCAPVKRFNRLIALHPELIRTDTIVRYDTVRVVTPSVKYDTSFIDRELHDTVYISKDKLKIKLWQVYDTVYVEGECESDTIYAVREVKVPVIYYKDDFKWWHNIPWWVYVALALAVGYYVYSRYFKK